MPIRQQWIPRDTIQKISCVRSSTYLIILLDFLGLTRDDFREIERAALSGNHPRCAPHSNFHLPDSNTRRTLGVAPVARCVGFGWYRAGAQRYARQLSVSTISPRGIDPTCNTFV
jgi:hypothetical protein